MIASLLLAINLIAFAAYFLDKAAARFDGAHDHPHRIPEASLHALSLLGGWPGALLARHVFRHKTRKQPFVFFFWLSAATNVAALYALSRL